MTTIPTSLVVDDDPPSYYLVRVTSVYCCNCKETVDVSEPFTVHPIVNGSHKRPIKHSTNISYYNLPVRKERANTIPIPFCAECANDTTFSSKPKAPPRKVVSSTPPSWVGANKPSDYGIAGVKREAKPPKAAKPRATKTYTLDDLD